MANRFPAPSRIVALTVAIALITSSLASAQTPGPPADSATQPALMSAKAFARLVQPSKAEASRAVTPETPKPSILRQSTALMRASAAPVNVPKQSWASQHKAAVFWLIVGGVIGTFIVLFNTVDGWDE